MKKHTKREDEHSPLAILNEVSLEGTSSLVEAQRTLLNLVQQENDIVMNGFKEQMAPFLPAVAVTDLLRRSLDTFIGMHQDFLTIASKHAISVFETGKTGKVDSSAHAFDLAREEAEVFARAFREARDTGQTAAYRIAAMLLGVGTLHFLAPKPFDTIVPAELPGDPRLYTYASGVAEVSIGALLPGLPPGGASPCSACPRTTGRPPPRAPRADPRGSPRRRPSRGRWRLQRCNRILRRV